MLGALIGAAVVFVLGLVGIALFFWNNYANKK